MLRPHPTPARPPPPRPPRHSLPDPSAPPAEHPPDFPRPLAQDRLPHGRRALLDLRTDFARRRGRHAGRPPRLPGPRHRRQRWPGRPRGRGAPPRRALPHHRQRPHRLPPPRRPPRGLWTPPCCAWSTPSSAASSCAPRGRACTPSTPPPSTTDARGATPTPAPLSRPSRAPPPAATPSSRCSARTLPPGAQVYLLCDDYGPQTTYAAQHPLRALPAQQHGAVERSTATASGWTPPCGTTSPPPSSLSLGAPPGLWPGAPHHRGRQPDRGHRGGQHLQGRAAGRRPRRLGVGRPLPGQHQHPPLRGALPPGGGQRVPLRRRAPRRRGWQRLPPRAVHERRLPGGVLHQRRRAPRPDLQLDLLGQRLPLQPPPGDAQHRDPRRVQRGEPLPAQRRPRGADGGGGGGTTVHAHDGPYNILRENYARILRVLKARDRDNRLLANWHVEPTVNQGTGTAQEGNQRVPAGWGDFPYAPSAATTTPRRLSPLAPPDLEVVPGEDRAHLVAAGAASPPRPPGDRRAAGSGPPWPPSPLDRLDRLQHGAPLVITSSTTTTGAPLPSGKAPSMRRRVPCPLGSLRTMYMGIACPSGRTSMLHIATARRSDRPRWPGPLRPAHRGDRPSGQAGRCSASRGGWWPPPGSPRRGRSPPPMRG